MSKLKQFFLDLFSRKKDPKLIPCDHIACNDCVFFYRDDLKCGIAESDIQDLQTRYTEKDIDKFKRSH